MFIIIRRLLGDKRGISAVEYGILIGVVGVALAGVMGGVGTQVSGYITSSISNLSTASTPD
jgi:Flp pilus assembly pilin Flp